MLQIEEVVDWPGAVIGMSWAALVAGTRPGGRGDAVDPPTRRSQDRDHRLLVRSLDQDENDVVSGDTNGEENGYVRGRRGKRFLPIGNSTVVVSLDEEQLVAHVGQLGRKAPSTNRGNPYV